MLVVQSRAVGSSMHFTPADAITLHLYQRILIAPPASVTVNYYGHNSGRPDETSVDLFALPCQNVNYSSQAISGTVFYIVYTTSITASEVPNWTIRDNSSALSRLTKYIFVLKTTDGS